MGQGSGWPQPPTQPPAFLLLRPDLDQAHKVHLRSALPLGRGQPWIADRINHSINHNTTRMTRPLGLAAAGGGGGCSHYTVKPRVCGQALPAAQLEIPGQTHPDGCSCTDTPAVGSICTAAIGTRALDILGGSSGALNPHPGGNQAEAPPGVCPLQSRACP